jgi:2-amino-4-hydroxy-6-hydroxymethyldihydropteridine diphosphokinase
LQHAVARLKSLLENSRVSTFLETEPVGKADQPTFLNGAIVGRFSGTPRELLDALMLVEHERGRVRTTRWGPRTLDLDLILFGNQIINEPDLTVPHPRFRERGFVLQPLAEIASDLIDPVTGLTVGQLWGKFRTISD